MVENELVGESFDCSDESIFTEKEADATPECTDHQNNSLAENTRLAETVRDISRSPFTLQLSEMMRTLNRPLFSPQLSETIRTINRPLFSPQLSETIRILNRPLFSPQLSETIRTLNRPLFNPWSKKGAIPFDLGQISAMALAPRLVNAEGEPVARPDSLGVEEDVDILPEEASFWLTQFDALVTDDGLRRCSRSLFADGYYSLAVQRAYIYIDNLVSNLSGRADKDGADLMRTVFSPKNPVLKLNKLQSRSEENQQQGYMHIFEGIMIGIRNPRVHEYAIEDLPRDALEMLVLANHLIRMLKGSTLA